MRRIAPILIVVLLAFTSVAAGQESKSYWGVTGSIVPTWTVPSDVKVLFDADAVRVNGGEFSIGVARGKAFGGDWGVTFIRKTIKDDSFIARGGDVSCFGPKPSDCFETGARYDLGNVVLTGIEGHKYVNFATIKQRVQVGLIAGGGIASAKGAVLGTLNTPSCTSAGCVPVQSSETTEYRDLFLDGRVKVLPLVKLELAVGAILAPGVKVRFSGGLNFPGYHVGSISVVYLIGSR